MLEYCNQHKDGDWCEYVKAPAKQVYCEMVCRSNPKVRNTFEVARIKKRWPLTEGQLRDSRMVSIMIPCIKEDMQYLEKTIDSLYKNAVGPIEFIVAFDGFEPTKRPVDIKYVAFCPRVGVRAAMNQMAAMAEGEFLLRIDAHCTITEGWDARMKESCLPKTTVAADIDRLIPETWQGEGFDAGMWAFDENIDLKMVRGWKLPEHRLLEEEMLCTMGQGYMIPREYYLECGGCDEDHGVYGDLGAEWSLKTWLTGGRTIMRTDVVCTHLFRPGQTIFTIDQDMRERSKKRLYDEWVVGNRGSKPFWWLLNKFDHYAGWSKDAKLQLQMQTLPSHIREDNLLDEDAQHEVPAMSGRDSVSAVESDS
jgi:glycosyltransferase involved in cell wall biosynthesis